ncbi:helix-turn-helix transcriptional regulator [Viridibacillus sp. FSL E2-0187]|uniref:helix-turn-helix domain-containing protein n=1 Tax=Viridibacillus sp. FSL E2-0187 TaxID=2921362 RepID=UPI0030F58D70
MGPTLGKRIKEIRLSLGLNMEEFGELVDRANKSLVSKWENDKSIPGVERLHIIANLGNTSYKNLIESSNTNYLIEQTQNLSLKLELSLQVLEKLKKDLEILKQTSSNQDKSSIEFANISVEISKVHDNIYNEILNIKEIRYTLAEINEIIKQIEIHDDLYLNKTFELENIFSLENISVNNKILSLEEKERTLQILKLIFFK